MTALKIRSVVKIIVTILVGMQLGGSARAEWSPSANFVCDDPLIMRQQGFFLNWFPRPGAVIERQWTREKYRVEINQKFINDGSIQIGKAFTSHQIEMNVDRLPLLKILVEKRKSDSDLPFFITDQIRLAAYILSTGETLVIDSIFKFLFEREKARHAKISTLEAFLAEGGTLVQTGVIEAAKKDALVAIETILYQVSLGREKRSFLLYSCSYPAIITFHGARTVGSPNPKIFKPINENIWGMFNADSGAKEREYSLTGIDENHVSLREAGNVPEDLRSRIRIHRSNGPVERLVGDKWYPLYQKTEAL